MPFATDLHRRRTALRFSYARLAALSGVHYQTISFVERGYTTALAETQTRLEAALRAAELERWPPAPPQPALPPPLPDFGVAVLATADLLALPEQPGVAVLRAPDGAWLAVVAAEANLRADVAAFSRWTTAAVADVVAWPVAKAELRQLAADLLRSLRAPVGHG